MKNQYPLLQFLGFRWRQCGRMLKAIGIGYLIFALVLCLGLILATINSLMQSQEASIGLLGVLGIGYLHLQRRDGHFLQQMMIPIRRVYIAEYLLLSIPWFMIFTAAGNAGAFVVQAIGAVGLAWLPNGQRTSTGWQQRLGLSWIPLAWFEWRAYLRRSFLAATLLYILCLALSPFIAAPLLLVLAIGIYFMGVFDGCENKELFESFHLRSGIIHRKVAIYLSCFSVLVTPPSILFLLFHFDYWYLLLVALVLSSSTIIFNILYKYAHYTPYRRRIYNSTVNSVFIFSILVPFFFPVTVLYILYYWRKARKNIQYYYARN